MAQRGQPAHCRPQASWPKASRRQSSTRLGLALGTALVGSLIAWAAPDRAVAQARPELFPPSTLPQRGPVKQVDTTGEFLLQADEVTYNRDLEIVTASGSVEIAQGDRVLRADTLSYDRKNQVVTAAGNIVLMEPSGDVLFADYIQVTDDLRDAVMENFRALLIDNSRLAARSIERLEGNRKVLVKGVFTPCAQCKDDPSKPPLWQIRGEKVVHDEVKKDVVYQNATLEFAGVPVVYLPYFSHPDPSVDRRSGFLAPTIGRKNDLGAIFGAPYYAIIDDQSDATIEPRVFSEEGALLALEYRRAFDSGRLRLAGSVLNGREVDGNLIGDDRTWRGNFAAEGRFDIDENWRAGFDIARATDRTYQKRFRTGTTYGAQGRYNLPNLLTTNAYLEGFYGRSYFQGSAFLFQSLRAGEPSDGLARIHPFADASIYSAADELGGTFRLDSRLLAVTRRDGADSIRLSNLGGYYLPWKTRDGHVFNLSATIQADAVSYDDVFTGEAALQSGTTGRVHPRLAADWRYPLVNRVGTNSLLIEPRVMLVAAPTGNNPPEIPNEDSRGLELDEANLFALNRFAGRDRVDSGSRVAYGLSGGVYGDGGGSTTFSIGQSVRSNSDRGYPIGSGLEDQVSDIVGHISVRPGKYVSLNYRFRLDHEDLSAERQQVSASTFFKGYNASVAYTNYDRPFREIGIDSTETITLAANAPIAEFWSVFGSYTRDIEADKSVSSMLGVMYRDECFAAVLSYEREFFNYRDIEAGTTVMLRVGFKYLGDFGG